MQVKVNVKIIKKASWYWVNIEQKNNRLNPDRQKNKFSIFY